MNEQISLSRTDFLLYLDCPLHLWARKHNRMERTFPTPFQERLMAQGREVEALARGFIEARTGSAELQHSPTLTDGPFSADPNYLVRDVENGAFDLYEVTSGASADQENEYELAFLGLVCRAGRELRRLYLVRVNRDYVRSGEMDPEAFFVLEDLTAKASARFDEVLQTRALALAAVRQETPVGILGCTDPDTCPCPSLCHPNLPANPIYDLARLGKKAHELKALGVMAIEDIPPYYPLTAAQRSQVEMVLRGGPVIDADGVRAFLAGLEYPLHFLDYETVNPALPLYDGYRPYDLVVFMFSVDVIADPEAKPVGHEHMVLDPVDPAPLIAAALADEIGPGGSVLVWNRSFEARATRTLAALSPDHAGFLAGLEARMVDLMDVFRKGLYAHPRFRGSSSLKQVLPVMVPRMTYEDMRIANGEQAMQAWWQLVTEEMEPGPRSELEAALLAYCARDTAAMVAIWEELSKI